MKLKMEMEMKNTKLFEGRILDMYLPISKWPVNCLVFINSPPFGKVESRLFLFLHLLFFFCFF